MEAMPKELDIPKTPLRFIIFGLRPFMVGTISVFLIVTVAQLLASGSSLIFRELIDAITTAPSREAILSSLQLWGGIYVAVSFVTFLLWRLSGFVGVYALSESKAYTYAALFEYLTSHSYSYFSDRFAGSVSNKISHASDGADSMMEQIVWHYYTGMLSLVLAAVILAMTNIYSGLIFAVLFAMLLVLNLYLVKRRRPLVTAYAESTSVLRGVSVDVVTNIFATMQYARRTFEIERIGTYIEDRRVKDVKRDYSSEWGLLLNNLLVIAALAAIMVVTYVSFRAGRMSVGDVVMTITLLTGTVFQLVFIGNMLNGFIRTYAEIQEGLDEILVPYQIVDAPGAQALAVNKGAITFDAVHFSYENQEVFNGLELHIAPGERVGIVGGSGAGKTTLVSLLLRQHEIQGGSIAIDGQDIALVTQDSLREAISLVPQDPQLFHRTIKENIAYGDLKASDADIEKAAGTAYAHEFIDTLPQKYDTMVGERGVKLSGGQRQRIAIARAVLKDAPILVLDEATSALDSASEVVIQKALHALMSGKTVIAIAHRLSTLREMNRIIVLNKGKVAESGTHEELLAKRGIYAELWGHQVDGFIQD